MFLLFKYLPKDVLNGLLTVYFVFLGADGDMRDVYAVIREDDAEESGVKDADIFWNDSDD